jgi:hypothetical protein
MATTSKRIRSLSSSESGAGAGDTWVYVWNLTSDKVGHTSIQIGGRVIKDTKCDDCTYMSIHPGGIPAIGPTTVLPLPASLARSLMEDMVSEANAQTEDPATASPLFSSPTTVRRESVAPDKVFCIKGLNVFAMKREMDHVESCVRSGDTSYQLLPRVNMLSFLRELPGYISQDPVDAALTRRIAAASSKQHGAVYNCATLVERILNIGGLRAEPARLQFPWDPTPNGIAERLSSVSNIKISGEDCSIDVLTHNFSD